MSRLIARITQFTRSPQGRRTIDSARRAAADPGSAPRPAACSDGCADADDSGRFGRRPEWGR